MAFKFRNAKQERDMEKSIEVIVPIAQLMEGKKIDYEDLRSIYVAGFEAGRNDVLDFGDEERPPVRVIDKYRGDKHRGHLR